MRVLSGLARDRATRKKATRARSANSRSSFHCASRLVNLVQVF
jgi:hypothetical protein